MANGQLNLFEFGDKFSILTIIEKEYLPSEYFEIEYKSAKNGFPKDFWKSYSAFGNTNTGFIILGVEEKSNNFSIEGLSDEQIENYKKHFWNNCNNPNTVNRNLLANDDVKELAINHKTILIFRIPFASRTERPVFLTRNPFGNTYKRNHEGDYRCTDDEIKRMLADSSAELKRDALILEHYTLDDFDPVSIKQYRQLFASSHPGHPWLVLEDIELLKKLGAYRIDRKTKTEGITLAGLLMFGKHDSIKEQEALPDYFPDFREELDSDEKIRWTDRIYPDGTWESNLLQYYLKVWPKLSSTLPKAFRIENDERIDQSPTHTALREAFINALVHTDYSLSGNIILRLDKEKFVFSNPGTLLVSLQQYYAGGISECRNPALQQMFMMIGRAEKAGSGVDKIMSGWKESHWRRPFLEIDHQPDRIKLTLPMFSVIPEDTLNDLNAIFGDLSHLSPDELTVLSFCRIEGSISNHRLQYVLNMHSADITNLLKNLCEEGYLLSDNNGRWTIYKINGKARNSAKKVDTSTNKVDTSISSKVDTSTEHADRQAFLKNRVDTSKGKVDTLGENIKKRLTKNELEHMIMKACRERYLKMDEVAKQIGKSTDYLKNKIFPKMIKEGKLKKRYPYTHNHPEQGYKTSKEYDIKL